MDDSWKNILSARSRADCEKALKRHKFKPATVTRQAEGATHYKPSFAGYIGVRLSDDDVEYWTRFGRTQHKHRVHRFSEERVRVVVEYDATIKKQVTIELGDGNQEFTDQFETILVHRVNSEYCDLDVAREIEKALLSSTLSTPNTSNVKTRIEALCD